MAFHEVRFPENIALGARGGVAFSTDVIDLYSGYEKRNANWAQARGVWNVSHVVKSAADMATLVAFFRARQGKAHGFRFRDWTDYQATAQNIGTGDGSTLTYQLRKSYSNGGVTSYRIINKPVALGGQVAVAPAVYVDGVKKTEGTHFNINYTTGLVTFTAGNAPASGKAITADFEFDVPVRFDTDQIDISVDNYTEFSWQSIPIVEIRV